MNPDSLQRFVFERAPVRGAIVHLDGVFQTVLDRHDYPPVLRHLLGELMAAAALFASALKFNGSLMLQMQGNGPVKLIVVECDIDLNLRATAKWDGTIHAGPLCQLLGEGRFAITLIPASGEQSYQGVVALQGENVAQALEHYMHASEQIDTRLWLAADAQCAAGMLLQKLPGSNEDNDTWQRVSVLGATLKPAELLKLPAQQIIHRLYHEEDIRIFALQAVAFSCSCSKQRVAAMLQMLGQDEVGDILAEQGTIQVNCEFCNQLYVFDAEDAGRIFIPDGASDEVRH